MDAPLHPAPTTSPASEDAEGPGLLAELRESVLLLGIAVTVTLGVTAAAQAMVAFVG